MRKASSTGTLRRLADSKPVEVHAGGWHQPTFMRRSGSSGGLTSLTGHHRKVASEQDVRRMSGGSLPHSRSFASRPGVAAAAAGGFASDAAAAHFPGPGPTPQELSVAEEMVEASYARGLAAAECFELYGPVRAAPPLAGSGGEAATAEEAASSKQLASAQQLAACLATPFTGTDKNMGEILRSEVDKLSADQELQTQLRYAEELRQRSYTDSEEEEIDSRGEGGNLRRVRIRRRPSKDSSEEQLILELELGDGGRQPSQKKPPPQLQSPDARAALDSLYSSMDCDFNRISLDDADISKGGDEHESGILSSGAWALASSDREAGGEPDQDVRKGAGRHVINVTATSAPDLSG